MSKHKELLLKNAWRFNAVSYAERMSMGHWRPYPWIVYVLKIVQTAILKGRARIIINAPPRHGKSEGVSHWLLNWYLDWYPQNRVALCSHGQEYANERSMIVRDEFMNNELSWTKIRHDKSAINNWRTQQNGGMTSVGIDGSLMGKGFDLGVIDDPYKSMADAFSRAKQREAINFFLHTFYNRCEPNASIVIIHTRWHKNDLTGFLMNNYSSDWNVIRLPALAEEHDPMGRSIGEALCPARWPVDALLEIKRATGSRSFAGLFQQSPAPEEGNYINRTWLKSWSVIPAIEQYIQSWDLSFDDKEGASYVVGQVWGVCKGDFYLVDQVRRRMNFVDTVASIRALSAKWPTAITKLIEKKANGAAVITTLRDSLPGIIPVEPQGSKEVRLAAVSGIVEAGHVYLPNELVCNWVEDLIEELSYFPNAANDDQVDAFSQALMRLSKGSNLINFTIGKSGIQTSPWDFG